MTKAAGWRQAKQHSSFDVKKLRESCADSAHPVPLRATESGNWVIE